MHRHAGVSRSCHRRTLSSGASPCSTNKRFPPCRSTRRISASAVAACGMVHKVPVVTTVSTLWPSSGMASADASMKPMGMYARMRGSTGHGHELRGRLERKDLPDRRPVEGQVKARADSDLDHSPLGRADHALAIRQEAFVAHRNIPEPCPDDVPLKSHRNVPSAVEMLGPFHLNVGLVPFGGASRRVYVD